MHYLLDMNPNNEDRSVSTAQVAKALGVSVTTVKRWVDDGILPAHKTVGGHRKLLMSDVIRLARDGTLPKVDITSLFPLRSEIDPRNLDTLREQFVEALRQTDAELVRGLIHGSYIAGASLEDLADRVISPAMSEVGHAWTEGRLSVMQEHRATQSVLASLYELRSILRSQSAKDRPVAVGGAPEHDPYLLPSLLAKLVLLDCGWDAINLGPHTPGSAFRMALTELKPRLIWISASHIVNEDVFLKDYQRTFAAANAAGVAVAVGGSALKNGLRERMPYTFFGDGFNHLAAFARTLHTLPGVPKRGRPRQEAESEGGTPENN